MKLHPLILVLLLGSSLWTFAQPHAKMELKKPEKYENKKLASERTDEKKFGLLRKFTQNGITKFNWHFNAKTRLELLLEMMKYNYKDDYSQLLRFYNYDPEVLSKASELDTVLAKSNAGILVHDLRNAWIDNLYLLMGQAYFYKLNYDTAFVTFQYLNYAFAPKEEDGYDIPIGSNAVEGGGPFKVSTIEKTDLATRAWSTAPSRNESLVWQAKTLVGAKKFPEANSLVQVLRLDQQFPERLKPYLAEVQAWYFYQNNQYDSAAYFLEQALPVAVNKEEKARWEYLIGQLYELSNQPLLAEKWFGLAMKHTLNPVLEVYARLNQLRQNKGNQQAFDKNIQDLMKMARRDQFVNYRDIIYYAAAQMELERDSTERAKVLLQNATKYISNKSVADQRSKAFLLLGTLHFNDGEFLAASRNYDSITMLPANSSITPEVFDERKKALSALYKNHLIILRQDSLQMLAAQTEKERYEHVRAIIRAYRKQNGLKEEDLPSGLTSAKSNNDLFNNNAKGEWYFNNLNLKSQGVVAFQTKWGRRPNVDNWRRSSSISNVSNNRRNQTEANNGSDKNDGMTIDALLANIPLTEEQIRISNDSIETSRFIIGKILTEEIEAYPVAVDTLEMYVSNYQTNNKIPEAYFLLYYCYYKLGLTHKAQEFGQKLKQEYASSPYNQKIEGAGKPDPAEVEFKTLSNKYDEVYLAYIEGNFAKALDLKKGLDTTESNNYYTPQLLYVETIYHLKTDQPDYAKANLQSIISRNTNPDMTAKAKILLDVINRKGEIEAYLNALQIEIPLEEAVVYGTRKKANEEIEDESEKRRKDSIDHAMAKAQKDSLQNELARIKQDSLDNALAQAKKDSLENALAKMKQDSLDNALAKAKKDSIENALARAKKDSLENALAQARKDSLENALAKMKQDSIENALAKARKDSLENVLAQMLKDSLSNAAAQARKDSLESALAKMKQDSIENALAKAKKDSVENALAKMRKDSLDNALAKAKQDSIDNAFAKMRQDSIENAITKARKDSLENALAKMKQDSVENALAKARKDSLENVLAKMKEDSIANAVAKAKQDSLENALAKMRKDSLDNALAVKAKKDSLEAALQAEAVAKAKRDSLENAQKRGDLTDNRLNIPVTSEDEFTIDVRGKQLVLIVMDQVDQVYVNEARNAFNAYNNSDYGPAKLSVHNQALDERIKFVIVNSFENAATALDYVEKTRSLANKSIVPWLPVGKYYFIIVSGDNLNKIKSNSDLGRYVKFLAKVFPEEFEGEVP